MSEPSATLMLSARQEWRTMWALPVVSMLGVSGTAMFAYSNGVFMQEMTQAFGWSRAQFSSAFVFQMMLGLLILPMVGRLTDRLGPRRIVLFGLAMFPLSFALLGLTGRAVWQWWVLCIVLIFGQGFIAQTIWVTAVIGRFKASRGLALAVTLCGLGVGSLLWPLLAAWYVGSLGWRLAFGALALTWLVIVLPLVAVFFYGAPRASGPTVGRSPSPALYGGAIRSPTFIGLMVAGGLFSSAYFGFAVHLVPILRSNGFGLKMAAGLAGLTGAFSICGRLLTGQLLDRFPTRPVAVVAFTLPAISSTILSHAGSSVPLCLVAVGLLGLSVGAEMDVITYVAAQRFGQAIFASVYAIFTAILALCASSGPVLAGALFDASGSYARFLVVVIPMVLVGALLLAVVPISATRA